MKRKPKAVGVACAVKWCVCLARTDSQHCAVHQGNERIRTELPSGDRPLVDELDECEECNGTGECQDCDGDGHHECEHSNCFHEHECPTCDGTGDCQDCDGGKAKHEEPADEWAVRYLVWVNDPGWQPWQRPEPWGEMPRGDD
jgi:hypothetical protein